MKPLFDISTTHNAVTLDEQGRATVVFTVTNANGPAHRAMFRLHALDGAQPAWLTLAGAAETDFTPGMVQQVEVKVALPPGAKAAKFRLRLDALSAARPEEEFTEGPPVTVNPPAAPVQAPDVPGGKKTPWWVWLVIALVVLAVVGLVGFLATRKKAPVTPPPPPPAPSAPAPTPVATQDFENPQVQVAGGRMVWLDLCREWANNCGKPAADAFCASKGLGVAHDFKFTPDAPPTGVIGTRQICTDAGCDRISWVRCGPRLLRAYPINVDTVRMLKEAQVRGKQITLPE